MGRKFIFYKRVYNKYCKLQFSDTLNPNSINLRLNEMKSPPKTGENSVLIRLRTGFRTDILGRLGVSLYT